MTDPELQRDPVEELAEEFLARRRRGEEPSIEDYAAKYPQHAERIGELFPALLLMEDLKARSAESGDALPPAPGADEVLPPLERLGDFRIIREIGRGGMGVVYEAEQESLGRRVAVKVLPGMALSSPKGLRRFRREAKAAARLHHTNIIPVFGVGQQDGIHYFVMQYIRGQGLDRVLASLSRARKTATDKPGSDATPAFHASDGPEAERVARTMCWGGFATSPERIAAADSPCAEPSPAPKDRADEAPAAEPSLGARPEARSDRSERTPGSLDVSSSGDSVGESGEDVSLPARSGPGYWRSVAGIGIQVADALEYAHHQGTLHRDIKPANLLLDTRGTVWVGDFGLAKLSEQDDLTRSGDVVGTLRYMAPEQFDGRADPRTDVYSLGLTLYEMLALRPAFDESDRGRLIRQVAEADPPRLRRLSPGVPRDLETVVQKAIARHPDHRYRSAGELAEDLQRFLDDRPIRARRTSPVHRLWRWCRRNKAIAALSALALGLLIAVAVVASIGYAVTSRALRRESRARRAAVEQRAEAVEQRKIAVAEYGRAEENLRLAMQAFEDIFKRIAVEPVYQPRKALSEETDDSAAEAADPLGEDAWQSGAWTSVVTDREAAVLQTMLAFYDRFAEQNAGNVGLQQETAQAYRRVGEIHQRLGDFEKAEAAYQRALETFKRLPEGPERSAAVADVAAICNRLGMVYRSTGRLAEAWRAHRQARDLLAGQSDAIAAQPRCRFELAQTYNHMAWGFFPRGLIPGMPGGPKRPHRGPGRGPPSDPADHHRDALEILRPLVEESPDRPEYRLALARTCRDLATALGHRDGEEAAAARAEAIDILQKLVADHPANPDYRFELAETYALAARHPWRGKPTKEDLDRLRRAMEIERELVKRHPNVPDYQAALARLHMESARTLKGLGRDAEAGKEFVAGIELRRDLADRFPSVPQYQVEVVRDLFMLAFVMREQKDQAGLRAVLEEAIQRAESMDRHGKNPMARMMLGRAYRAMADVLRRLGEDEKADQAERKAKELGGFERPFSRGRGRFDRRHGPPKPKPEGEG